jgi:hypothetical protein
MRICAKTLDIRPALEQRVTASGPDLCDHPVAMTTLTYTEAFRTFGAKLVNPMWAYSAVAEDGAMVLSCWSHKLKLHDGVLSYQDRLSRWEPNTPGKNLLVQRFSKAVKFAR